MKKMAINTKSILTALSLLLLLGLFQNCNQKVDFETLNTPSKEKDSLQGVTAPTSPTPGASNQQSDDQLTCQALAVSKRRIIIQHIDLERFTKIIFNNEVFFDSCDQGGRTSKYSYRKRLESGEILVENSSLDTGITDPSDPRILPQQVKAYNDPHCNGDEELVFDLSENAVSDILFLENQVCNQLALDLELVIDPDWYRAYTR